MGREQILRAKMNLSVAYRSFDRTLDGAGRILQAENELRFALAKNDSDELHGAVVVTLALSELAENLIATGNGDALTRCGVQQESARFMAAAASEDGLTWPIQVMESGFANGHLEMADPRLAGLPHFFPKEVVAQVAEACNNARFGRRHPATDAE